MPYALTKVLIKTRGKRGVSWVCIVKESFIWREKDLFGDFYEEGEEWKGMYIGDVQCDAVAIRNYCTTRKDDGKKYLLIPYVF